MSGNLFESNNSDLLIRIWEKERETRNFSVKLMWENMKYFGSVIGALIAAHATLLTIFFKDNSPIQSISFLFLFPLPMAIIFLSWYARKDLTDRQRRFFLVVSHLLKLELLLGLYDDDPQSKGKLREKTSNTSFKKDDYLFAEYQENLHLIDNGKNVDNTEDFIEFKMHKEKGAFNTMRNVYIIMIAFAGFFLGLQLFILVSSFQLVEIIDSIWLNISGIILEITGFVLILSAVKQMSLKGGSFTSSVDYLGNVMSTRHPRINSLGIVLVIIGLGFQLGALFFRLSSN